MTQILYIAQKEFKELIKAKSNLVLGVVFAVFFAFMYSQNVADAGGAAFNSAVFFLSLAIALFTAYTTTAQVFLLEKRDGVIETLMCAPVSLRQIWAGKTIGGLIPSWLISLLSILVLIGISSFKSKTAAIPDVEVIVHVLIAVPVFISAFVGLVGFGQLLLGMKENRLLNFIVFMPAFAALYGAGFAIARNLIISWTWVGIVLGASLLLSGLALWLAGHLSRERIVTTIE